MAETHSPPPMRQVPLALVPEPAWRLDTFVPGANTQWPQVQAALLAPQPATPLYLWGPAGCGKSHLLRAAASLAQERGLSVAAHDLRSPLPWDFDEQCGLLLLDDCDRYDTERQRAAFALFVQASTFGVPVLAAGRLPPVDLTLREDLRTRLGWGLVYELVPPSEDQVRALLRREGDRRGVLLNDDVIDYLLKRCARDLSHLMHLLDRIDRHALSTQRAVTLPLLRQVLNEPETA
ncbi:HdaA/DnaA family protein [Leptothrix discophora]|uniref:DnaA/Hda family protein n=1 Tax=Leptothrix discophora TaxID=89 RepID=A0ABT9G3A4_LEPDI|nr:DnaA/Hda family protein [Leptothrix discophora]MDP4300965.1 DnaA/Hda family protein [Leptothrix discophora]